MNDLTFNPDPLPKDIDSPVSSSSLPRFLRNWKLAVMLLALISTCNRSQAATPNRGSLDVERTLDRGVAFLARDAVAWKNEHHCSSCHHAALVVWSLNEAKGHGHAVDDSVLTDMTQWLTQAGDGKFNHQRPASAPKASNPKAVYYALGLNASPLLNDTQRDALNRLLMTVKEDQTESGSWVAWPETRPPIFGPSDETMTLLSSLALLPAAGAGDLSARAAIDKAVQWLTDVRSDNDPQSIAMRLLLWTRLGRPRAEWLPLVRQIKRRQNRDGGWSQTAGGPSDAWATGQALYVLAGSGVEKENRVIRKGCAFLMKAQHEDGSWPMTSRPARPGGPGSESLIPITGGGSAWAVMGLVAGQQDSASASFKASAR